MKNLRVKSFKTFFPFFQFQSKIKTKFDVIISVCMKIAREIVFFETLKLNSRKKMATKTGYGVNFNRRFENVN